MAGTGETFEALVYLRCYVLLHFQVQAVVTRKQQWIKALALDTKTGLDPPGVKVRSAQGLDAASYFVTGYWIWSSRWPSLHPYLCDR